MENNESKIKKKKFLPARLNILFMFVFLLFTLLIIRLGFVQIVNGDYFKSQSEMTTNIVASVQTERGKMFDRNGELVVSNIPSFALTYIRIQGTSSEEHLEYAEQIAPLIDMPPDNITERDKQDYWILKQGKNEGQYRAYEMKLTEEELASKELDDSEKYKLVRERITEEELVELLEDEDQEEILAIKRELDRATNLDVTFVKKGLTVKEMAVIGEHLGELGGRFSIASTAERSYPKGESFFFGSMKSIPADEVDRYLLKGYARNNQVGTSYLEQQYEGILSGKEKTYTFTTTKDGTPIGAPEISPGSRGYDLILSVDMNLQEKITEIIDRKISEARGKYGPVKSAYVVMMEPNSGEVLAMVGRKIEDGKFVDDSYKTLQSAFEVGSTVKGATVLAMHQMGGAPSGINDKSIDLGQGLKFSSYTGNIGTVDDKLALEQSSNVYMGIGIGRYAGLGFSDRGGNYRISGSTTQRFKRTFQELRDVYSSVGLGVKTGIDLPGEALGYEGPIPEGEIGQLLYFSIGQYDTYTPIQLAQYVSTIANGGYRIQPHLLKEVRIATGKDELGPLVSKFETNVINRIDNTDAEIKRVQDGFYQVTHGSRGTAKRELSGTNVAGKTGTAQIEGETGDYNLTFIGYAPYDNPKVAISVVVPNINGGHVNVEIAKEAIEAFNGGYTPEKKDEEENKEESEE